MKIAGIIPARYASTRLPGKPLLDILGKSMIRRVYEQSKKAEFPDEIIVATDDDRIYDHVESFGGKVLMTSREHTNGTDRCAEALEKLSGCFDYVVNIQGDEPLVHPDQIDALCRAVRSEEPELATLIIPVETGELLWNEKEAKVVVNHRMEALYFSRSVIPFIDEAGAEMESWHLLHRYYRHVGMYAYRADILHAITHLPPSPLEEAESLEQLRWLEAGYKIKTVLTDKESHAVDTLADLDKILSALRN